MGTVEGGVRGPSGRNGCMMCRLGWGKKLGDRDCGGRKEGWKEGE